MADWSILQRQPMVIQSQPEASGLQQTLQGIQAGLQIGGNIAGGIKQYRQGQAEEAANERQQAFNTAFGKAYQSGDKNAVTNLIGQFPEQFAAIKQIAGFQDEQQNKAFGSLGLQLKGAIDSNNPQAAAQLIAANQDVLRNAGPGFEPEGLLAVLQKDPQALAKRADMFALTSLGLEQYYKVMGDRDGNLTTQRGQDITAAGQKLSAETARRGQDIQKSEGAADRASRINAAAINAQGKIQAAALAAQAGKELGAKDVRQINSDLTNFTKEHTAMFNAAKSLETLEKRDTSASQLAAVFAFMKSLDPTSVVREGEQVQVMRTDGIFGTAQNYISQLNEGKRLNPKQMKDLVDTAKALSDSQAAGVNGSIDNYLESYGGTIPKGQKALLEKRKAQTFGVAPPTQDGQQAPPQQGTAPVGKFIGFEK